MKLNVKLIKTVLVKCKGGIVKNSPAILAAAACVGVVSAVVYTAKVAPQGKEIIDDTKAALADIEKSDISEEEKKEQKKEVVLDTAKDLVPIVVPPVVVTGLTIGCIIGAHKINMRRQALLITACDLATKSLDDYQAKVKEVVGEKKEKEKIQNAINQDYADRLPANIDIIATGDGNQLICDKKSGQVFRSSMEWIRKQWARINQLQASGGFTELNRFYELIGINPTDYGEYYGWNETQDNWATLDTDCVMKGDEPMIILLYDTELNKDSWALSHIPDRI